MRAESVSLHRKCVYGIVPMDRLREIAALGAEEILILGVAKVCVISHVNRNANSRLDAGEQAARRSRSRIK